MGKRKRRKQDQTDVNGYPGTQQGHEWKGNEEKLSVDDLVVKVEECMENLNFELAEKLCNQAVEMSPDNQQALNLAASVFLEVGKTEKAADCLKHAIEVEPEKGYTKYMSLGQLLNGEEAAECFKKGIQLMIAQKVVGQKREINGEDTSTHPESEEISDRDISDAFCSLAEIYLTDCCVAEDAENICKEYCEKAIEQDPSNPDAYQVMANFLLSEQKNEEAKKMLKKSLNLWKTCEDSSIQASPPSYESRISLSKMLIEVEDNENAGSVLEGLLHEDDEVVQVWYLMGWIHYLSGEDDTAVKYYLEKAKKLFTQMDCNDEPLLEHIEELLSEINTKIASKTESLQDKDKDEKTNFPGDQRIETMDTMS